MRSKIFASLISIGVLTASITPMVAQTNVVQNIARDVYFHQGDHRHVYCINGWIVFNDYVLVVDANYPAGAAIVAPKIREVTPKPVRYVWIRISTQTMRSATNSGPTRARSSSRKSERSRRSKTRVPMPGRVRRSRAPTSPTAD